MDSEYEEESRPPRPRKRKSKKSTNLHQNASHSAEYAPNIAPSGDALSQGSQEITQLHKSLIEWKELKEKSQTEGFNKYSQMKMTNLESEIELLTEGTGLDMNDELNKMDLTNHNDYDKPTSHLIFAQPLARGETGINETPKKKQERRSRVKTAKEYWERLYAERGVNANQPLNANGKRRAPGAPRHAPSAKTPRRRGRKGHKNKVCLLYTSPSPRDS